MAAKFAVGSAAWISAEKENVLQQLQQEQEEMIFPAQHEIEWLNEHMAGIFNSTHVDVANVFKTPGKLRGKTPRTIRKRAAEPRIPLSDIFSSKPYQPPSPAKFEKEASFHIAKDDEEITQPSKSQTDSGYHGSSQVEEVPVIPALPPRSPLRTMKSPAPQLREQEDEILTNEGSFHSAKENYTAKLNINIAEAHQEVIGAEEHVADAVMDEAPIPAPEFDDIGSPSDESTPDRPFVRKKSSMTFASLPAREPLKTSIGARVSRTSHIQATKRDSHNLRNTLSHNADGDDMDSSVDESNIEILGVDTSDIDGQVAKQYSKASTQRLHEKIDALGKAAPPRLSKPVVPAVQIEAILESEPKLLTQAGTPLPAEDEDDWIKPLSNTPNDQEIGATTDDTEDEFDVRAPELIAHEERMSKLSPSPMRVGPGFGHTKSVSTATLASPAKSAMAPPPSPSKPISLSNIPISSTTPAESPRRMIGGPLSASKTKLASIMKTAKGLFTSSASVSAAAKLEAITPKAIEKAAATMPGMFPDIYRRLEDKPLPASPPVEGKRTRSSTERQKEEKRKDKEAKVMQQMEDQLARVRDQEQQKVARQNSVSPRKVDEERLGGPSAAKTTRPVRPTRDASKAKPQPLSIKIGTLSQRIPTATSSVASSIQEILPIEPKRPGLVKKASNASMQSSASTFKSSVSSQPAKPKALLAAERKKEQDERDAQRKLEQKKEAERKRAAQQEEARRIEQEQRAEAERKERERLAAERAKRQAQQEAIERKRQEAAKKAEAQRAARDVASARPPSRLGQQVNRPLINHPVPTNPAKPAKRPVEEEQARPQAPKFGAASQQMDAKRRRTEDENMEPPARPTMSGAPIRQSQLGKKPSIFNHPSYTQAPQPHINQFPQPPNRVHPQMSHFATSKIPFAEPSGAGPTKTPLSAYQHRSLQAVKSSPQTPHYQNGESIHLPDIPTDSEDEDSEDEGNAFPIPDWATPGHLTEQLMRQEGMDGDAVFGPIAPLKMEEIFAKGNKDRLKRLRDRTSSANWVMSGDGLTLEEIRVDREQRERMRLEGGWRYGT